jgi:hypothetical protein
MAERIEVGRCTCPICRSKKAHLRVNVKQLAYIICNACNVQIQARSDRSDELLKGLQIVDEPEPVRTEIEPVHVRTNEPEPAAHVQTKPAPEPAPVVPPPKPASVGWGMLRGVPTR